MRGMLVTIVVIVAVAIGSLFYMRASFLASAPPHFVDDYHQWPALLRIIAEKEPSFADDTQLFQHDVFLADKTVWLINGQSSVVESLILDHALEPVTGSHPKIAELQESMPEIWSKPAIASARIYASSGYGTEHQEGVDLLLLVRDSEKNTTLVLHEWIF